MLSSMASQGIEPNEREPSSITTHGYNCLIQSNRSAPNRTTKKMHFGFRCVITNLFLYKLLLLVPQSKKRRRKVFFSIGHANVCGDHPLERKCYVSVLLDALLLGVLSLLLRMKKIILFHF